MNEYTDVEDELFKIFTEQFWKACRKNIFESFGIWDRWTLLAQAYHNV